MHVELSRTFSADVQLDSVGSGRQWSLSWKISVNIFVKHIPEMNLISFLCNFGGLLGEVIAVAFALNNICEEQKIMVDSIHEILNSSQESRLSQPLYRRNDRDASQLALDQRNSLKNYFNSQLFQPWDNNV